MAKKRKKPEHKETEEIVENILPAVEKYEPVDPEQPFRIDGGKIPKREVE